MSRQTASNTYLGIIADESHTVSRVDRTGAEVALLDSHVTSGIGGGGESERIACACA